MPLLFFRGVQKTYRSLPGASRRTANTSSAAGDHVLQPGAAVT